MTGHTPIAACLRAAAVMLPLAFLLPAAARARDYNPHILTLSWPGHQERLAATSEATCRMAIRALVTGLWQPFVEPPVSATCAPGSLFAPRSHCIEGYGCDDGGRR